MKKCLIKKPVFFGLLALTASTMLNSQPAIKSNRQSGDLNHPNIVVIFGDDIGITNISAYGHGVVGYRTPNIDSIARDGMMFTDFITPNKAQLRDVLLF